MDIISAVVLGIVQGITEFLPISSTGHLILAREVLQIYGDNALAFDAILHLTTALAVIVYFFDEIWVLVQTVLRKLGRLPINPKNMVMVKALLIGTIPAVVFGLLLESFMETTFRHPLIVAGVLIVGSGFFIYAEYKYQNMPHEQEIDVKLGLKVGLFQVLALVPGFSRAGATICGGMLLGLTRSESAKFAFLLSVPVILGAGSKKLFELFASDITVSWMPIIVGGVAAFVVGLMAIHFLVTFIRTHTLWPFIWYRLVLAAFVIFVVFFG